MSAAGSHPSRSLRSLAREQLASATMARAFTLAVFAAAFCTLAISRTAGAVTAITIITGLCVVAAAILFARREELSVLRFFPTSLAVFMIWALASALWSTDAPRTIIRWAALAGFALLALTIAHIRDTLQTVRALGDVLRWLLGISLGLEVLSGILLDIPIAFLGIQGNIALGGPIQGLFGTRNLLGFVTVIALITFVIEWRTQSVGPGLAMFSVTLAGILALLSASPTVLVVAVAVAAATGALSLVRHTAPARRPAVQWAIASVVVVGVAVGYFARNPIIDRLGVRPDLATRVELWNSIIDYSRFQQVQGWGWFGPWAAGEFPFNAINFTTRDTHRSALNAFFDTMLQLGWVGLAIFVAMGGIALVRSWLVASERRSVVYGWTPIMLIALLVTSMFESFALSGFAWLLLVICVVRAGQSRSWRESMHEAGEMSPRGFGA